MENSFDGGSHLDGYLVEGGEAIYMGGGLWVLLQRDGPKVFNSLTVTVEDMRRMLATYDGNVCA